MLQCLLLTSRGSIIVSSYYTGNIDYIQQNAVVEFGANSTVGATLCTYITILGNYAVQDTKNFTVYLTSNSSDVLILSYAQSVPVQILGGITQCKAPYNVHEIAIYVNVWVNTTDVFFKQEQLALIYYVSL